MARKLRAFAVLTFTLSLAAVGPAAEPGTVRVEPLPLASGMLAVSLPSAGFDAVTRARLGMRVTCRFHEATMADVAAFLARTCSLTVVVDPRFAAGAVPLDLALQDAQAGNVLRWACRMTGAKAWPHAEGIWISDLAPEGRQGMLILCRVDDLLSPACDFPGPRLGLGTGGLADAQPLAWAQEGGVDRDRELQRLADFLERALAAHGEP